MQNVKLSGFVLMPENIAISRKFYEEFLDQEIEMNINDINVAYKSGLTIWQKEYAHNLVFKKQLPKSDNHNLELYFETVDLDSIFAKAEALNLKFEHKIMEQPWMQRCFRVYDPDNFLIEIAESMPAVIKRLNAAGMPEDEIIVKTMMPAEIVKAILSM
jgi:uncharacterized glyoxalase superfamily protein PhnB